jgi:ribonuclease Z
MTTSRISRTIVSIVSVFFAATALGLWIAPEYAARQFGVDAARATGTAMLRADLGGLFAGMAVLCGAAAWTKRRPWIVASGTMLTAIVVGRALGWIAAGRIGGDAIEMAIEIGIIMALIVFGRSAPATITSSTTSNPSTTSSPGSVFRQGFAWQPRMLATTLLVVPVGGAAMLLSPAIAQRLFDAGAERRTAAINTAPLGDDALRVAVCGSSAPLPSAPRAKTCAAVFAGGKFYVVDVGPESVENLVLWGIPLSSVGGVLLTHFHSDHIGDLGELNLQTWAGGRPAPLDIYGGPGVEQVVDGFNRAYRLDQGYRTAHHTDRVMPQATWPMVPHTIELTGADTPAKQRTAVVLEEGGLRITAIEVDHAPITPAYAYRFDYKGRSALITGDLKFHPSLIGAAQGVDLLLSEAMAPSMTRAIGKGASAAGRDRTAAVMHDIEDYHMTPEQAAEIANSAQVKLLAFYHLLPAPDGIVARHVFSRGVDQTRRGDWTIAEDGSLYTMNLTDRIVRIGRVVE